MGIPDYSRVSNRRDSPFINYSIFATLPILIQHSLFINFGEFCQPPPFIPDSRFINSCAQLAAVL